MEASKYAKVYGHVPGYNSVICHRAEQDAKMNNWFYVPFGMDCKEAVESSKEETDNIPDCIKSIVVPVGSGMSLSGIMNGIKERNLKCKVYGTIVGADPKERLKKWCNNFEKLYLSVWPESYDTKRTASIGKILLQNFCTFSKPSIKYR